MHKQTFAFCTWGAEFFIGRKRRAENFFFGGEGYRMGERVYPCTLCEKFVTTSRKSHCFIITMNGGKVLESGKDSW